MKTDRKLIHNKYNGRCAYCGNKIEFKAMQVDHKLPKRSSHWITTGRANPKLKEKYNLPDSLNGYENLMPTCRRCNHYKRALLLEDYRTQIKTLHTRIEKQYISKVGVDYNIITVTPWHGWFFFELWDMGIIDKSL